MNNEKILAKALADIVEKRGNSKYKICATPGYVYIMYADIAMYTVQNLIGITVNNPEIEFSTDRAESIIDNSIDIREIEPTGRIFGDLTEFADSDGCITYVKTKLLDNLDKYPYHYTLATHNRICIYEDSKKDFLCAIMGIVI